MPIIGIDLGTSNSAAAVLRGGRPIIIPSAECITLGGKARCAFRVTGCRHTCRRATSLSSFVPRTIRALSVAGAICFTQKQSMHQPRSAHA